MIGFEEAIRILQEIIIQAIKDTRSADKARAEDARAWLCGEGKDMAVILGFDPRKVEAAIEKHFSVDKP